MILVVDQHFKEGGLSGSRELHAAESSADVNPRKEAIAVKATQEAQIVASTSVVVAAIAVAVITCLQPKISIFQVQ